MALLIRRIFSAAILLPAGITILFIFSCRSTTDLVLDDPAFREDMVNAALQGEKFNITPEDYPEIRRLLTENHPDYRLAGVIIAIQADDKALYPDIVDAALDENLDVSETAREVIRENPEVYRPYILNILEVDDPSRRAGGLLLLTELGAEDIVPILIDHFNDTDPGVRDQASRSVREVTDRSNLFLRDALDDPDPLTASIAYRTLGRYVHPDDTPVFVSAFASEEPGIRREAQLAALRLGDAGLPFLHIEAANPGKPYRARLSALEVIQGLRSTGSLTLLMVLLDDRDERIGLKAETILGTYGSEAIPALAKLYGESTEANRIHAVRLMGEIASPSALPILASALDDSSPEVRRIAIESLVRFGEEAWPAIRTRIDNGGPRSREISIAILRGQSDPWLVILDNGTPNLTALLLLITTSETEELTEYLKRAEIPRLKTETIISLKKAWDIAEELAEMESLIAGGNDPYLYAWRQQEIFSVAARKTLQRSFNELHEYFETRDPAVLEKSRKTRAESRRLEDEARKQKNEIENMNDIMKAGGELRVTRYRDMRDFLVRTWEYAIPELRPLAEAVYADRGLDPKYLARESALLY